MSQRSVVRILLVVGAAIALGFAGFVWWKLQPHRDPQPLPATLVALDSDQGQRLLEAADGRADYGPLAKAFEPQKLASFCGVASSVAVLNAMGHGLSQDSFFTGDTDAVRSRLRVTFGGMTLAQFSGLLRAHGVQAVRHPADASTLVGFRAALEANLSREGDFIVVNYERGVLGQGRVGHISPLAAYDRDSDMVLILDTAAHKYPPTWAPVARLFAAMQTVDRSSGAMRGYVEIAR